LTRADDRRPEGAVDLDAFKDRRYDVFGREIHDSTLVA